MLRCAHASKLQIPLAVRCISTGTDGVKSPLHFLNGQRVEPKGSRDIPVLNPATGAELLRMRESNEEDVNRAVASAKQAFADWSRRSGKERGEVLTRAAFIMKDNIEEISKLETLDNGKPLWESRFDTEGCADSVAFYGGVASTIMGRHLSLPGDCFSYTRREPLGVIGAIGAFNYPLQMACWKSAPALACGNTVVFKPSPLTPVTSLILAEIYKEAGLPDGCFNVIQGETKPGQWLSSHPDVAKVTFTGSVPTGSKIMEACAKDIRNVTLELGGKSPVLIFDDCDLENAVKGTMMANYLTQGQVCSNGTRVFVHKNILNKFTDRLVEKTRGIKVGDPMQEDTHMGAMISETQAHKVLDYIEKAKQEGGKILIGGERVTPSPELANGWYISPCVVSDVTDHMTVAKEEIFGPVVSILTFEDEDDVIARANNSEFGLAAGVFTKDLTRAHRVAAKLETGNVYINNYNIYPVEMPFGGNKKSGIGREGGLEALDYFTQVKHVNVEGGDVWCPY